MIKMTDNTIDAVITWVDGGDPEWLAQRAKYLGIETINEARYRDWGLLPYWFRCIEKFAPWIRKIHFVTWGHLPSWLDLSNPKLHIVKHSDFIPEKYLPTFNSHTIELNLHRITGLAEQFIYFNDDCYITKPVKPEFFFTNGLPCDTFSLNVFPIFTKSNGLIYANDIRVINDRFLPHDTFRDNGRKIYSVKNGYKKVLKTFILHSLYPTFFVGFFHWHVTFSYLKTTFEQVWQEAFDDLDTTCSCRFRQNSINVGPTVIKDWQLASGNFNPRSSKFGRVFHLGGKKTVKACSALKNQRYTVLCVNDNSRIEDVEHTIYMLKDAFNVIVPEKSSFEL